MNPDGFDLPTAWLKALEEVGDNELSISEAQRLGDRFGEEASRFAINQSILRKRGESKLKLASKMLFDREALEQSSHEAVAAYHASLFPDGCRVADLTCGIGADTIALARNHDVIGYEIDSERISYATWNLQVHNLAAQLHLQDCREAQWNFEFAFLDPGRRLNGSRIKKMGEYLPSPIELRSRLSELNLSVIKLSPILDDRELLQFSRSIQFVSFGGECREALAFLGSQSKPGVTATRVETGAILPANQELEFALKPLDWIYEADPAAIRAHALGNFGMAQLGNQPGYLTSSEIVESEWLTRYRRLTDAEGNLKQSLRVWDKAMGSQGFQSSSHFDAVKTRTKKVTVEEIQKVTNGHGFKGVILIAYETGQNVRYVLVSKE